MSFLVAPGFQVPPVGEASPSPPEFQAHTPGPRWAGAAGAHR